MAIARTLVELFDARVSESGDCVALQAPEAGRFVARSWNEIAADVNRLAAGLRMAGIATGDRIIQISENRYEWIVADLAIHLAQGVHVAVHAALAGPQMAFQILDTEARIVLLSNDLVAQALARTQVDWPRDLRFYSYQPVETTIGGRSVEPFPSLIASAGENDAGELRQQALDNIAPDTLATILYSSGTTGEPKGVMLSHGNLTSNAIAANEAFLAVESDVKLCWLPLSHIFARTCDLYCWLVHGSQLVLAESREQILANAQQFRPTMINGVPYFYDKVRKHCESQGGSDEEQTTRLVGLFGGRMQLCCSGGAPLPESTAEYFTRHGVPLMQGYGLTETSPVITVSTPRANQVGAVGRPIQGVEVKIAGDGEILTRGSHVMPGYWRQPQATAAAIRDGWLCTGDIGRIDDNGYLWITGRKKELIVTSSGKNIAPAYLERLLTEDPLIQQAFVVGDRRSYLAALVVPNPDALRAEIVHRGIAVTSREEALRHPEVLALYRQRIDAQLAGVGHCEQIGRFTLIGRGFTAEHDELTPTLKLRRSVIQQHFAAEIEAMYTEEAATARV